MGWRIDTSWKFDVLVKEFGYEEGAGGNASFELTMSENIFNRAIRNASCQLIDCRVVDF